MTNITSPGLVFIKEGNQRGVMSIVVEMRFFNTEDLLKGLQSEGVTDLPLAKSLLDKCGEFIGDTYVLLHNEYYTSESPAHIVDELFREVFELSVPYLDSFDKYNKCSDGISNYELEQINKDLDLGLIIGEDGIEKGS